MYVSLEEQNSGPSVKRVDVILKTKGNLWFLLVISRRSFEL